MPSSSSEPPPLTGQQQTSPPLPTSPRSSISASAKRRARREKKKFYDSLQCKSPTKELTGTIQPVTAQANTKLPAIREGSPATHRQGPKYCRAFVTSVEASFCISLPTTQPPNPTPKTPQSSPFSYITCLRISLRSLPPYHRCQTVHLRQQELGMRVIETLLRQLRSADPKARLFETTGYHEQQHLLGMDSLQHDTPVFNYLQDFSVQLDGSLPSPCQVMLVHNVNPYELLHSLQHSDNDGNQYDLPWSRTTYQGQDLAQRIQAWQRENFIFDRPYGARVNTLATILKTSDDSTVNRLMQAVLQSSPPITCSKAKLMPPQAAKVLLPLRAVKETLPVYQPPSSHSASFKQTCLCWLLAVLERLLTTSWDLVAKDRWKPTNQGK